MLLKMNLKNSFSWPPKHKHFLPSTIVLFEDDGSCVCYYKEQNNPAVKV